MPTASRLSIVERVDDRLSRCDGSLAQGSSGSLSRVALVRRILVWNDPTRNCRCSPPQIQRYVGRISGPLLDRIDIHIDVPAVKFKELRGHNLPEGESSGVILERVLGAREIQLKRLGGENVFSNSAMSPSQIRKYCPLDAESEKQLEAAMTRQGLSARAHARILKVARTIADLDGSGRIQTKHIGEAISYRSLDRTYWM